MHKARIGVLDGFRAIAILSVILFHFFSLGDMNYPYQKKYDFFSQGKYGVEFFFIISGFVIYYTLENTEDIKTFFKKRFIRLYPSAFVATSLTFLFLIIFSEEGVRALFIKYISSLSLVGPKFLNLFIGNKKEYFSYLDYSLWSLWPEIQFYIVASAFYFLNKKQFVRNFTLFSAFLIILFWFNSNILGNNSLHLNQQNIVIRDLNSIIKVCTLTSFIQYFELGILFYVLFKNKQGSIKSSMILISVVSFFIIIQLYFAINTSTRITNIIMLIAFIAFIYFPQLISVFDSKLLNRVGVSSYFLYLIHQAVGLVLIEKLGPYILPHTFLFPFLLIVGFISLSIWYTYNVEKPIMKFLRGK